ncbi:MAG: ATP-binding protein [Marinoscillum sp.]
MSSVGSTEEYIKNRIEDIMNLIYEVAAGNFDYKLEMSNLEGELEGLIGGINMLGEELKASTVSRDFMESIYRGVADILIILRTDLTIERVNDKVLDHLGFPPQELVNKHFRSLIREEDIANLNQIRDSLETTNAYHAVDLLLARKDGTFLETSVSFSALYDNQKKRLGTIIIAKDISALKESERELKIAKDKAEAASRAKSSFLANMSHEIRTPLNGMLGFIELLSETKTTEMQAEYLKMVKVSGDSLSKLLNDILDLNKVEQGKLSLESIRFVLEDSLKACLYPYKYQANERGLKFDFEFDTKLPSMVVGDPSRINQVIRNLVGNALKFTEKGYINVRFELEDLQTDNFIMRCVITDTGIGIPEEKIESIFESFTQADSSTTRRFGGSGLGLTISRHLISLMAGEISVESPAKSIGINHGSIFTMKIPLQVDDTIQQSLQENAGDFKPVFDRSHDILVVDDNDVNLMLAQKILESMNLTVYSARNGKEAVTMALKKNFDIIFMDVQMPIMDGYAASAKLRKSNYFGPIIALSANVYNEDIKRCYENGMNGHLRKPFTKKEIYNKVLSLVN